MSNAERLALADVADGHARLYRETAEVEQHWKSRSARVAALHALAKDYEKLAAVIREGAVEPKG